MAPLVAFLVLPGLSAIPSERWADARLDGLSTIMTVRHVALPAIRPLALAVAMLLIGGALATFDSILTLTGGGPGTETMTPALYATARRSRSVPGPSVPPPAGSSGVRCWSSAWSISARRGARREPPRKGAFRGPGRRCGRPRPRSVIAAAVGVLPNNNTSPPSWIGRPTLDHLVEASVVEPTFWQELATSIAVSLAAALVAAAASFLAAFGLARSAGRSGRRLAPALLVLASLPAMAYVVPLSEVMRRLGLLGTLPGIILAESARRYAWRPMSSSPTWSVPLANPRRLPG